LTNSTIILQHYRYWVLWRCPAVRFLDYQKVRDAERKKAKELFGTASEPSALASKVCNLPQLLSNGRSRSSQFVQIMGVKSRTFDVPSTNGTFTSSNKNYRVKLTDKERKKVEELIRNAKSLQDIVRLEKELNEGRVPAGAQDGDDAMEE
jgi:U2 small nuclear ribonucleoprotein A'